MSDPPRGVSPDRHTDELRDSQYYDLAKDTFEEIEHFFLNLAPLIWTHETTISQARITGIVFARQMAGKKTTVSCLADDTGIPRTTVQNAVDRMISDGWIKSKPDPSDGRKRLLVISKRRARDVGLIEQIIVQNRLNSYHRMAKVLGSSIDDGG